MAPFSALSPSEIASVLLDLIFYGFNVLLKGMARALFEETGQDWIFDSRRYYEELAGE